MGQLLGRRNRRDFQEPIGKLAVERRGKGGFTMLQREKSQPDVRSQVERLLLQADVG